MRDWFARELELEPDPDRLGRRLVGATGKLAGLINKIEIQRPHPETLTNGMKFLSLLLLLGLLAGCVKPAPDPQQLRADEIALIRSTIADPARAERMLALLGQRDRLVDETRELLRQYRRETAALNADYDARREVVVEIIDVYNRERARIQLRFIDLISAMKSATTAAEWKIIAEFQLEYFDPRRMVYRRSGSS